MVDHTCPHRPFNSIIIILVFRLVYQNSANKRSLPTGKGRTIILMFYPRPVNHTSRLNVDIECDMLLTKQGFKAMFSKGQTNSSMIIENYHKGKTKVGIRFQLIGSLSNSAINSFLQMHMSEGNYPKFSSSENGWFLERLYLNKKRQVVFW